MEIYICKKCGNMSWEESNRSLNTYQTRSGFVFRPRNASMATASLDGGTDVVLAADTDAAYQVYWMGFSNAGDATRVVSLKWGSGDTFLRFAVESGGNLLMNFIGAEFCGGMGEALNGTLDDAGEVYVTVAYSKVVV